MFTSAYHLYFNQNMNTKLAFSHHITNLTSLTYTYSPLTLHELESRVVSGANLVPFQLPRWLLSFKCREKNSHVSHSATQRSMFDTRDTKIILFIHAHCPFAATGSKYLTPCNSILYMTMLLNIFLTNKNSNYCIDSTIFPSTWNRI